MAKRKLIHEDLTERVIGAAIEVHRHLGPGLLESAYSDCLAHELTLRGVKFRREVEAPIRYKDLVVEGAYRMDFVVADSVIVEAKAVEKLARLHEAQLLTYLRVSGRHVGLLINFDVPTLKDGIVRLVL